MSIRDSEAKPAALRAARLGLAAAFAVAAVAAPPAAQAQQEGLRVFKDPVTGQLRAPTAKEAKALEAAAAKQGQPRGLLTGKTNPQQLRHANGTVELELTDSNTMYSVATRAADGSTGMYCVPGSAEAAKVMKGEKTAAKVEQIGKGHEHE
ncbi:MAG: hypothetical protein JSR59_18320 [Proteobacteria bacterium]|nr:hypothetical protein [Pseudomonadota bacterium]